MLVQRARFNAPCSTRHVQPAIDNKIARSVEFKAHGPLAQLVEQLTLNQRVGGSSPPRLIQIQDLQAASGRLFSYLHFHLHFSLDSRFRAAGLDSRTVSVAFS